MEKKSSPGVSRCAIALPKSLDADLEEAAAMLGITKAEAMRRALTLFKHAARGDRVEIVANNERQVVLVK